MTMTSEPGESLAAAESLAGESASERRKARLAVIYVVGAFVAILVPVSYTHLTLPTTPYV